MSRAVIAATHVLCAIGNGTEQAWAAARAGIARISSSHIMDRHFEPISMGLVPEAALGELTPSIDELPLPARARRMLRLAAPALKAVGDTATQPAPVFVGLPYLTGDAAAWVKHVPAYLATLTGVAVDKARSVVAPQGRAAALLALEQALDFLDRDPGATVIVGGVDSYFDLRLLAELDAEGRLLGQRAMEGFIPGEGAAFFTLRSVTGASTGPRSVVIHAAASALDPGHRYGDGPAKGEGLAFSLDRVRRQMSSPPGPVATTFAGFNGESFDAKLWGVARVRHSEFFAPDMAIEHPADKYGDAGAATGAILTALAAQALATGTRRGPALVWAASDHEPRACAVLSVQE